MGPSEQFFGERISNKLVSLNSLWHATDLKKALTWQLNKRPASMSSGLFHFR